MIGWTEIKESAETSDTTMQKWGALASFLLVITFVVPPWIYLTGNVRAAIGPFVYALADLLSGPVRAASLIIALVALRERIGERAPRRISLALLAALIAAGAMVGVACIRSANRQYLLSHPELSDSLSTTLLTAWGTIVTGMNAAGWQFLGWAFVLVGVAGWASRRLPRGLSVLYLATGAASLFVYVLPDIEGLVVALGVVVSLWQSIVFWRVGPGETQMPGIKVSQLDRA